MSVLTRVIKAAWNEASKPPNFVKGDEFEDFIRNNIFPPDEYECIAKTHDYADNKNDFVKSSTDPDFKFRSRKNGKVFLVEAKYRSAYFNNTIQWCKPYQLPRYEAINREIPVYVVIGVGNSPSSPEHIFLVPVKRIKYLRLFRSFLEEYEIPHNQSVRADKLIGLLMDS